MEYIDILFVAIMGAMIIAAEVNPSSLKKIPAMLIKFVAVLSLMWAIFKMVILVLAVATRFDEIEKLIANAEPVRVVTAVIVFTAPAILQLVLVIVFFVQYKKISTKKEISAEVL